MSSKFKNVNKHSNNNENITIDAKHNEMINYFNELNKSLPNLKKQLHLLIEDYKISKDNSKKHSADYIIERSSKKDTILELKEKIESIINNKELNSYYLKVGSLLHNYYENVENSKNNKFIDVENFESNLLNYDVNKNIDNDDNDDDNEENNNIYINNNIDDKIDDNFIKENKKNFSNHSVLTFFENRGKTEEQIIERSAENNYTSMKISDFVKEESKFKKKNFLDDYLQKIDKNYVNKIKVDHTIFKCKLCSNEMTVYHSEGYQICSTCGNQEHILIESDKPSFKDPPLEVCYFSYKRINHFNEWLAQFQAKESTEIPDEVYEKIIAEIKRERIIKLDKLDTKKIRQYLKKIKLNKYYDHAAHILYQINGISPPSMSKELEEKLRLMFKEIQAPFLEVCPKSRKNFLNYSYVLHKFVELLSLDEYKVYFPLLKDREKLHQTDMIWKNICQILGWHFIKSI
jgi:ribosomal protein S27E